MNELTKSWRTPPKSQSHMFKTCIQHRKEIANWDLENNKHWQKLKSRTLKGTGNRKQKVCYRQQEMQSKSHNMQRCPNEANP